MRTGLESSFSRECFEREGDLQALCRRLSERLTARVRAATDLHMEIEWIVADLRRLGHSVKHWDGVIANWDGPQDDPYLWICIEGVDPADLDTAEPVSLAEATVGVSFRPRLPDRVQFRCPLCWSEMADREILLSIRGHGSAVAPGVQVRFECPGVEGVDATIGTGSLERRRDVRVCTACGAGLLLPSGR